MKTRYMLIWLTLMTVLNIIFLSDCLMRLDRIEVATDRTDYSIGKIVHILHWQMEQINGKKLIIVDNL